MTAPDLAFWKDCLHDYFAAKSGSVGKKGCRLKVSEILSVASLPAFTGNPQVAGTALKQDGRFHKFGKYWGLKIDGADDRSGRLYKRMLKAGAKERLKDIFVKNVSGRPNSLIPKHKGHGKVPHIKGRIQTSILEMDMMVSIEIYQAVACMYSQKQFQ
eukprot:g3435.t1